MKDKYSCSEGANALIKNMGKLETALLLVRDVYTGNNLIQREIIFDLEHMIESHLEEIGDLKQPQEKL